MIEESYKNEFEEMGYRIEGPACGGPVSFRLAVSPINADADEDYELIVDLLPETKEPCINMMCINSSLMKGRTDDANVMDVLRTGWLADGTYFQITNLPVNAAAIAETQPHQKWTEVDFWMGARDLSQALFHLHRNEVVHAAFSPWTVYQSLHGTILGDLWWAHNSEGSALYEDLTEKYLDLLPLGCLPFTAPEVLRGDAPCRTSDMFSLGAVLFFILTGSVPRILEKEPGQDASKEEIRHAWASARKIHPREFRPKLDPVVLGLVDTLLDDDPWQRLDPFELEDFIQDTLEQFAPA